MNPTLECGCGELVASKVSNCGTKRAVQSPLSRRCLALKQRYGITYQERTAMYEQQGGCCLICNNPVEFRQAGENDTRAVIDHCHSTGKIRGILCATCNIMLGKAKDNTTVLRAAISYLEKFNG